MRQVTVVTDSVACLPRSMADESGILVIPVRLAAEGHVYRDVTEDLPPTEIQRLQAVSSIDTTPWPPEHYCRVYREVGGVILHVIAFSQFTSTISLARAGAAMAQQADPGLSVEVLDSASTAMAQGFIALAAARAAGRGASLAEVTAEAERVRSRVSSVFALDSLRYLARTGRVPRLTSWAGSLLRVTPVVALSQGKEHPIALTRSRGQAVARLLEQVRAATTAEEQLHVAVMASTIDERAMDLQHLVEERFRPVESLVVQLSPITQIVAGPGLLGLSFYTDA